MIRSTASRVADALSEPERMVIVLGGDCTVGIGTMAGVRQALGPVALAYFDLHSDLNAPDSASDGALDWMALAHTLAIALLLSCQRSSHAIYLRAGEIAQLLGMSERTIRRWIADEIIPSTRLGGTRLVAPRRPRAPTLLLARSTRGD
jgi:excisionase family DNA binding protein